MTFNVPSFFVGVGTVLLTLMVGFGGGVLMTGVFSDNPREPNKLERRATDEIKPEPRAVPAIVAGAAIAPAQSQPVTQAEPIPPVHSAEPAKPAELAKPAEAAQAPSKASPAEPVKPAQRAEPAAPAPVQAPPARTAEPASPTQTADSTGPQLGPQRPVSLVQPGADEQARETQEATRKAQDAKARAEKREKREKRKAERRRQVAEQRMRQEQQRAVAERLRRDARPDFDDEEAEERPVFMQRERGIEPPPFRLFNFSFD